jgi:hypothetical protein
MQRIPRHLLAGVIVLTAGGVIAACTIGQLDRSAAAPVRLRPPSP